MAKGSLNSPVMFSCSAQDRILFFGLGSFNRTYASASAAIQASAGVDHVLTVALGDSANGATLHAGTAADASVRNNICHENTPPYKCTYILSQLSENAMLNF